MLVGGTNGLDILSQLKKEPETQNIPVIVLTNLDSEEKTARDIGAQDYLVKANVSRDEIVEIVKKYVK